MDFERLPAPVEGDKLCKMLDWTIRGLLAERFQNGTFQPEMLYEEIIDYLDMMKEIVYQIGVQV